MKKEWVEPILEVLNIGMTMKEAGKGEGKGKGHDDDHSDNNEWNCNGSDDFEHNNDGNKFFS
jgi:hypothetical protein